MHILYVIYIYIYTYICICVYIISIMIIMQIIIPYHVYVQAKRVSTDHRAVDAEEARRVVQDGS